MDKKPVSYPLINSHHYQMTIMDYALSTRTIAIHLMDVMKFNGFSNGFVSCTHILTQRLTQVQKKLRENAFTMLIIRVINEKIIQASPHKLAQNMSTKPI